MDIDQRVDGMEKEFKILKGEIKQVLLDLRGMVMEQRSPLVRGAAPAAAAPQVVGVEQTSRPRNEEAKPQTSPAETPRGNAPSDPPPPAPRAQSNSAPDEASSYRQDRQPVAWDQRASPRPAARGFQREQEYSDPEERPSAFSRKGGDLNMAQHDQSRNPLAYGNSHRERTERREDAPGRGREETRGMEAGLGDAQWDEQEERSQSVSSMVNANLVTSLIYWASVARRDVGAARMRWLIDLYGISSQLSPGARQLLACITEEGKEEETPAGNHINGVLSEALKERPEAVSLRLVELFQQLHGILCGDKLPVHVQPLLAEQDTRPPVRERAANGKLPRGVAPWA